MASFVYLFLKVPEGRKKWGGGREEEEEEEEGVFSPLTTSGQVDGDGSISLPPSATSNFAADIAVIHHVRSG